MSAFTRIRKIMATPPQDSALQRDIYSISRLNSEVRSVLEGSFPLLWVEGEVSNLARPSSGHIYFSLKDPQSQVRCAMFRMKRQRLRFQPENGSQVLVRARVGLYEPRGEFQLIIEHMEAAGEGALRQAFEVLKQRLADQGLFDTEQKRQLPEFPRQIGLITSPSGAAIRDILSVLKRRFPAIPLVIYPVPVQGEEAPRAIVDMIRLADQRAECDLLILARGGGSLEDLMAFNDEGVARTIFEAQIPIVSAIGHEIDFTIADFVADHRAATPSAAAELVSPDREELNQLLNALQGRQALQIRQQLDRLSTRLNTLEQRLGQCHPGAQLQQQQQRQDELEQRLQHAIRNQFRRRSDQLTALSARVHARTPAHHLTHTLQQCSLLDQRLVSSVKSGLEREGQRLATLAGSLHALSPLATLERGYCIVRKLPEGEILRDASRVSAGDQLETRLARGRLLCRVEAAETNE